MDSEDDEDITNLIERPAPKYIPPARYISQHHESIKIDLIRQKSAHKTLGVPNVNLNPPTKYLRKKSRIIVKRNDINHKHYHRPDYQHKLPAWTPVKKPSKTLDNNEDSKVIINNSVDFKKQNIVNVKKSKPSTPRMHYVDDRRGSSFPLLSSGLVPQHRNHMMASNKPRDEKNKKIMNEISREDDKKIGRIDRSSEEGEKRIPRLAAGSEKFTNIKKNVDTKEKKKVSLDEGKELRSNSVMKKGKKEQMCRFVTEEERAELLLGMQKKWDEIMKKFQCLPFLTDTPPKVKRKSKMEEQLKQLEKDIDNIQRHPYIYVYDDDNKN